MKVRQSTDSYDSKPFLETAYGRILSGLLYIDGLVILCMFVYSFVAMQPEFVFYSMLFVFIGWGLMEWRRVLIERSETGTGSISSIYYR